MEITAAFLPGIRKVFNKYLLIAELVGLAVVALATLVAMVFEVKAMLIAQAVTLTDLLLLFLYLEVLAMTGQYVRANHLPVKFPLLLAMGALSRELILGTGTSSGVHLLETAGAILLLAVGLLLIRIGQVKYPAEDDEKLKK
jgi:protein PsiE